MSSGCEYETYRNCKQSEPQRTCFGELRSISPLPHPSRYSLFLGVTHHGKPASYRKPCFLSQPLIADRIQPSRSAKLATSGPRAKTHPSKYAWSPVLHTAVESTSEAAYNSASRPPLPQAVRGNRALIPIMTKPMPYSRRHHQRLHIPKLNTTNPSRCHQSYINSFPSHHDHHQVAQTNNHNIKSHHTFIIP